MAFRLPRLPRSLALVEKGVMTATVAFQRFWQSVVERIENAVNDAADAQLTADTSLGAVNNVELSRIADALELLALAPRADAVQPDAPFAPIGPQQFSELADVLVEVVATNDVLVFSLGRWRNVARLKVPSGGTGASSFTAGHLIKGDGTDPLAESLIYDDGTNIGIGTTSPEEPLEVAGSAYVSGAGSTLFITDKDFKAYVSGGDDAVIEYDTNDYLLFNRSGDGFELYIGGAKIAEFTATAMVGAIGGGVYTIEAAAADSGGVGYRMLRIPN